MNKLVRLGFIFLLALGAIGMPAKHVHADETASDGYSISIVKYKFEDPAVVEGQLPLDGTKAEEVKDTQGNALTPLKGFSYEVTRVSPVQGTTTFEPVLGDSAFSVTVTTDEAGVAHVANLAQGTYRVVEKEHELLKETMAPVILELPLPQRTGEALNDVYIYPKSSITTKGDTPTDPKNPPGKGQPNDPKGTLPDTKGTGGNSTASGKERLPQTSGNIGSYHSLLLVLAFIVTMTLIGFGIMKTRKFDF